MNYYLKMLSYRTFAVENEPPTDTLRRSLYDECNFQFYSLIYRFFNSENLSMVDVSGILEYDGRASFGQVQL